MDSYLLTWNPLKYNWQDRDDLLAAMEATEALSFFWSCGPRKRMLAGDRVFLHRQGPEPRGIIGSGWVLSEPQSGERWVDATGAEHEATTNYVEVDWDTLVRDPLISRAELDAAPLSTVRWDTQSSSIHINAEAARALEVLWGQRTGSHLEPAPDEVPEEGYAEGLARLVLVNAYERNAAARQACLKVYGTSCSVCQRDLGAEYGPDAEGLIHVHHLVPLAAIGRAYRVDPVRDLRPVCPNCHAVLHRREPPFSIEEVRAMLARGGESRD